MVFSLLKLTGFFSLHSTRIVLDTWKRPDKKCYRVDSFFSLLSENCFLSLHRNFMNLIKIVCLNKNDTWNILNSFPSVLISLLSELILSYLKKCGFFFFCTPWKGRVRKRRFLSNLRLILKFQYMLKPYMWFTEVEVVITIRRYSYEIKL